MRNGARIKHQSSSELNIFVKIVIKMLFNILLFSYEIMLLNFNNNKN